MNLGNIIREFTGYFSNKYYRGSLNIPATSVLYLEFRLVLSQDHVHSRPRACKTT